MNRVLTAYCLVLLCSCGGGGGGGDDDEVAVVAAPAPQPTPVLVTQCGDVAVDLEAVDEIVEAAEEEDVDVSEIVDEPVGLNQAGALKTGVIIANCGSTVVTNDSVNDNDTVTTVNNPRPAERLLAAIRAHEVASLEMHR
ncbi:hypothetical protein EP7_004285 [Isosphaeraceae bacterium EP7]